jgi:hypothetical protein
MMSDGCACVHRSDRRRSAERRNAVPQAGYIVFTHPSGAFLEGDSSRIHEIERKTRLKAALRAGAAVPRGQRRRQVSAPAPHGQQASGDSEDAPPAPRGQRRRRDSIDSEDDAPPVPRGQKRRRISNDSDDDAEVVQPAPRGQKRSRVSDDSEDDAESVQPRKIRTPRRRLAKKNESASAQIEPRFHAPAPSPNPFLQTSYASCLSVPSPFLSSFPVQAAGPSKNDAYAHYPPADEIYVPLTSVQPPQNYNTYYYESGLVPAQTSSHPDPLNDSHAPAEHDASGTDSDATFAGYGDSYHDPVASELARCPSESWMALFDSDQTEMAAYMYQNGYF